MSKKLVLDEPANSCLGSMHRNYAKRQPPKSSKRGPVSVRSKKAAQCRKKIEMPFALISADRTLPYGLNFSSFYCEKSGQV